MPDSWGNGLHSMQACVSLPFSLSLSLSLSFFLSLSLSLSRLQFVSLALVLYIDCLYVFVSCALSVFASLMGVVAS